MSILKSLLKNNASWLAALFFVFSCNTGEQGSAAAPKTDTIVIQQMAFNPAVLEVKKGDTVVFINKGIVPHDVTGENKEVYSDTIRVGSSWKWTAVKDLSYYCSIHPTMRGKVVLK